MKSRCIFIFTLLSLFFAVFLASCKAQIKEPAVAGSFYPADKNELKKTVDSMLAAASDTPAEGRLLALITPHAGYQFSGQIAAYSYRKLKGRQIKTVILIGPSHHAMFKGASVYAKGSLRTPLGLIGIDEKIARLLIDEKSDVRFDPAVYEKEHSIEVQLPFLQETLENFRVVPILVGSPTAASFEHLTGKIAELLRADESTVLIASTDLSHYHEYGTAVAMDNKILEALARMSVEDVQKYLSTGECEMCGGYPVLYTMAVARQLGATNGVIYKYANSGDVTGDKSRVVGYAAAGLYKSALTETQKGSLLGLAKKTIAEYVTNRKTPDPVIEDPRLTANGATFVTINRGGSLRGCIGNIQPTMPLYRSVIQNAASASSKDPRFPPMTNIELHDIEVEISVLSPFEPLKDIREIEIGKHGIFLVNGQNSGIFLPQVATEMGWDKQTFLEQLSLKAGLPKDTWQKKETRLFTFTADIIR